MCLTCVYFFQELETSVGLPRRHSDANDTQVKLEGYLFKRTSNAFKTWVRYKHTISPHLRRRFLLEDLSVMILTYFVLQAMVRHPEEPVGVPETISRQSDGDGVGFAIMYRQTVRRNRSKILL